MNKAESGHEVRVLLVAHGAIRYNNDFIIFLGDGIIGSKELKMRGDKKVQFK